MHPISLWRLTNAIYPFKYLLHTKLQQADTGAWRRSGAGAWAKGGMTACKASGTGASTKSRRVAAPIGKIAAKADSDRC